ncbi:hypothetical protein BI323_05835 [Yersinia ruckeri]|uniref:Uncharacterized protein n=2 Tax=Yersiniaceae TaxID=1903411 RepID=A0A380QRW3_YERRU|nr:hypothetical protein [Yersinia enterocolitica]KGA50594.1 hypothetical protein DJ39_2980 [Yersinia ruckeri ATCC 29473]OEU24634.1 hypothetical protein BI323_05835 [Yersinia ruckeri]VDZ51561.1 Uncharacterised protein [Yersinia intermedia]EKN3985227.1 hypothetical protein [Yersinia enterocolitica]EKN6154812.1 hypothetical protein [Yersinia enterocolitica]
MGKTELFLKTMIFSVVLMCVGAATGLFVGFHYDFKPVISVVVSMSIFSLYLGYWIYSSERRADRNFAKFRQMQAKHEMTTLLLNEAFKDTNRELFDRVATDAPDSALKQQYQSLKRMEQLWSTKIEN